MPLITYLGRVQFDFGAVGLAGEELAGLGVSRPLIVTDTGVAAAGLLDRLLAAWPRGRPVRVFDGTPENPTETAVLAALEEYRTAGCDGVVAIGGGSPIDLAKAVALLATHPGSLQDYGVLEGGTARITARVAPVLAIPTTAGTGAEVGRASSITLRSGRKIAAVSPHLIPRAAICDPELTVGLPPRLTAATGMDALSHGIEAFLSTRVNPPADAIALDCVARVARHLERAWRDGADRRARWEMMMGALEGGLTFQKGLGAVHAMSHPLGELGLHHGTLNALLLPAALRFNRSHAAEKYPRLGAALGLPPDADPAARVAELTARLGLPRGLREMGVKDDALPAIAEAAAGDHLGETNPRPASAADYARLLADSM
ncbi:MAG: iron-containing alcohol dehydrogenase [Candidatus Rokuibacteriota bacterium]